jgi:UDP-2-acetamido-3-amino-2,3-dideoxy-glucuronate N-acetyltransferase
MIFLHVELDDFVFYGPFMVFTHISFPRAVVNRREAFAQTLVKTRAMLGANSTVVPGITVGTESFLSVAKSAKA